MQTLPELYFKICYSCKEQARSFTANNKVHTYNTKASIHLYVPQVRTDLVTYSPQPVCVRIFNKPPQEINDELLRLRPFKAKLRKCLTSMNTYTLKENLSLFSQLKIPDDHGVVGYQWDNCKYKIYCILILKIIIFKHKAFHLPATSSMQLFLFIMK